MGLKTLVILLIGLSEVISTSLPCNQPVLSFTEDCENAISKFQFETTKKINFKKPLNGKVKITFPGGRCDATRLRKCISLPVPDVIEMNVKFQDNIVVGKAVLKLKDDTKLEVEADENGLVKGIQRTLTDKDEFKEMLSCEFENQKWKTLGKLPWMTLSERFGDFLLHSTDLEVFVLCKGVSENVMIDCAKIHTNHLVSKNGFVTLGNIEPASLEVGNFVQSKQYSNEDTIEQCKQQTDIRSWLQFINSDAVTPYFHEKVADHLIDFQVKDFETEVDLTSNKLVRKFKFKTAIIVQNGVEIFSGKVVSNNLGKMTIKFTKKNDEFFQPHIPSEIRIGFGPSSGVVLTSEGSIANFTVQSYICNDGKLCGLVKRYGQSVRDPICSNIATEKLAHLVVHNEKGEIISPTFDILVGDSLIYNPSAKFPTKKAAYFYDGANFAIYGSFDANKQLKEGQKVKHQIVAYDENLLPKLHFDEPEKPEVIYHYKPPTTNSFGDQPTVSDEIGEEYLEIRKVNDYKGDGLFAKVDIPENTVICQYGGFRFSNNEQMDPKYQAKINSGGYRHSITFCDDGKVDIPHGFEPIHKYNATYGHKINHTFGKDLVQYSYADTPRNGLIAVWRTKHFIKKDEQLHSNYGYPNLDAYTWYRDEFEAFKKSNPDHPKVARHEELHSKIMGV